MNDNRIILSNKRHNIRHNRIQILPYTKKNKNHNRIILSVIEGTIEFISGLILSTIGSTIEGKIKFKSGLILSTIDGKIEF